jgi:hypothetical protein
MMMMEKLPTVVFPLHDPDGLILSHLDDITPFLKQHFSTVFWGITTVTHENHQDQVDRFVRDDFFQLLITPRDAQIGTQFRILFQRAASFSPPDQILHLCYPDRFVFALQDRFRNQFLKDIKAIKPENTPIIFQRSPKAWDTHPYNYYEIESFITTVGKRLLGTEIDFAWCHLAIQAFQLGEILSSVHRSDLSMVTEMIIPIINIVKTQNVDWLAWEDPFIYSRNAEALKTERENSVTETLKRLAYVIPMIQVISGFAASR